MTFNEFNWHPKFIPQDILIIGVILNYQTLSSYKPPRMNYVCIIL